MKSIIALICIGILNSGCVMVLNYAPNATKAMLYDHEQSATNMSITETIPITAQMAQELTGVIGANLKGTRSQA